MRCQRVPLKASVDAARIDLHELMFQKRQQRLLLGNVASAVGEEAAVQRRDAGFRDSWEQWHAWEALRGTWATMEAEADAFTLAISARQLVVRATQAAISKHLEGPCGPPADARGSTGGRRMSKLAVAVDRVIAVLRDSKEDLRATEAKAIEVR